MVLKFLGLDFLKLVQHHYSLVTQIRLFLSQLSCWLWFQIGQGEPLKHGTVSTPRFDQGCAVLRVALDWLEANQDSSPAKHRGFPPV